MTDRLYGERAVSASLVNCFNELRSQAHKLPPHDDNLGNEQLEWLEDDLKGRTASTPIVVFAHIPLWSIYPAWGWGTEDAARALDYLKRFGSPTIESCRCPVLN